MDAGRPVSPDAHWPARLAGLVSELRAGGERRARARPEAWILLRDSLLRFLRGYAAGVGAAHADDLEDLASTKALEMLVRAESGDWNPAGRHDGEVAGYVAAVARNGLTRWAERRRRQPLAAVPDGDPAGAAGAHGMPTAPGAEEAVEAREFIEALRECAGRLQPRSRHIWFLRAFLDLPSRDIAEHPDVRLRPAHVDVVMHRARDLLKTCLEARGLSPRDFPTGAFTRLWEAMTDFPEAGPPAAP